MKVSNRRDKVPQGKGGSNGYKIQEQAYIGSHHRPKEGTEENKQEMLQGF